jgi:hypothetical protein
VAQLFSLGIKIGFRFELVVWFGNDSGSSVFAVSSYIQSADVIDREISVTRPRAAACLMGSGSLVAFRLA